jgi:arylformamidase
VVGADDVTWREREYSPSTAIGGDYEPYLQRYRELSDQARATLSMVADVAYGPGDDERLDLFPAGEGAPLLVFIHGGYWQELSKEESAFLAPTWCGVGVAHAVIGYTLAPAATLPQIVEQCRRAIRWLADRHPRIVIAGSSAGAYLAAACADLADGVVLLSGIYDLRPLLGTSINDAIGLDEHTAAALSIDQPAAKRALVAWGQIETAEFRRQSWDMAARLDCDGIEVPRRNHFDVVHELADPTSPVFQLTRRMLIQE